MTPKGWAASVRSMLADMRMGMRPADLATEAGIPLFAQGLEPQVFAVTDPAAERHRYEAGVQG